MNRLLLDTSAYAVFLNSVILGELLPGFEGGTRVRPNREILNEFLSVPPVVVELFP